MTRIACLSAVMIAVSSVLAAGAAEGQRPDQLGPHDASAVSPYRVLSAPAIGDVQIADAFWAPRMKTCREVTLPYAFEVCEKTGRISNFVKAAGRMEGKFEGIWFNDSDVYKVLQGAAYELAVQHDPELDRTVDTIVAKMAAAQQPDGYLFCFFTIDHIDQRGNDRGHTLYGSYSQDHLPVRRQSEIVGHAVRAMYHCIGMADLYAETGDEELLTALHRLWQSTTRRKMYVTGGVGARARGEAFGADYELPNATAYAETCAQIGLVLWAHRMLLIEPNAEYADVMERVLYNGFLSGLSLKGTEFFYQNRLATGGDYRRQAWYGCACCPSNVVRIYPQIGRFMYACDERSMCVWMAEDPLLAPPLPPPAGETARVDWTQSYDAGYTDSNGAYAGGSEIMHLVPHQGRLFAANGYWMDSRWVDPPDAEKQSAQVLRLDAADGSWQVDLDMGASGDIGARYMKGNILKSVTFTSDGDGHPLSPPRNLLVMAAGNIHSLVSVWVRNERNGNWDHGVVKAGTMATGVRWVPRDMEVYRDKVTGIERIFLVLGNPGIISGVYDASQPTRIRWDEEVEFPTSRTFRTRPLGIVQANGALLFSVGGVVYRRIDGPSPTYTEVLNLGDGVHTDVGGIRGLTTIANPHGAGESLLFLWAPHGRSTSQVKRLDPDGAGGYTAHDEANLTDLMSEKLGVEVGFTLGAHSNMYPVVHPVTGETVHLIGFQGNLRGSDHLKWQGSRLYGGALYAIRAADRTYTVHEVNGAYAPGKPILVSPRTFARSPFGDKLLFVGGHDCSGVRSDDMAWIFKASLEVVLGPLCGPAVGRP